MIIKMRAGVGKLQIELVASALSKAKYDVQIKNGKGLILIAALGLGHMDIASAGRLPGVERAREDNELFNSTNGEGFIEFDEFFRGW